MQRGIVALQLVHDRPRVAHRIRLGIERREVDDVQQQARALQVAEEAMAEARAVGCALDQPGNVGDDEAPAGIGAHDAEVRRERRERIVGNLGARGRHGADERALARVGQTEQPDVSEHAELELRAAGARRPRRACAVAARGWCST